MDYYEDNRGRSESMMSLAELDLNDLERSLAEVKENLLQVLEQDNEQVAIPHYYQLIQGVNNMAMVTESALKGQENNGNEMKNLFQQNADLNQRVLVQETQLQSAEDEMRTQNQRIEQLEADLQLAESNFRGAQDELNIGKEQLDNYLAINKDLQGQIEAFTKASKDSSNKVSDTLNQVIHQQNEKIMNLEKQICELNLNGLTQKQTLTALEGKYDEVLQEKKQQLKELQQNAIIYEKNQYKSATKIKEYKYVIHEQKKGIMELETEIEVFKHKQSVANAKQQAQAEALGNSFTEFQNPKSRGQSMHDQRRPAAVSTASAEDMLANVAVDAATPTVVDDKGGEMDIEAPNDLGDFEGEQNNDLDGFQNDVIGRGAGGLDSYVTDNSKRSDLIQEYQEYRSNGSEEERDVYNEEREVQLEDEAAYAQAKRDANQGRKNSYLQSITEEGTILSDHELFQDPLRSRDKTAVDTQDEIYNKRDPEEEFFMLSVLALKMLATEKFDDTEYIYEVNAENLFNQVREDMPFHQWYSWLEAQFESLRQKGLSPYETPTKSNNKNKSNKKTKLNESWGNNGTGLNEQNGPPSKVEHLAHNGKDYLQNIDTILDYDESQEPPKTTKSKGSVFSRFFKKGEKKPKRASSPGLSAPRTDDDVDEQQRGDQLNQNELFGAGNRRERTMTMNQGSSNSNLKFRFE